jgi:hypothetical protein
MLNNGRVAWPMLLSIPGFLCPFSELNAFVPLGLSRFDAHWSLRSVRSRGGFLLLEIQRFHSGVRLRFWKISLQIILKLLFLGMNLKNNNDNNNHSQLVFERVILLI